MSVNWMDKVTRLSILQPSPTNLCGHYLFQTYKSVCLCVQVMQEEFSHTVLHHNRAAAGREKNTSGNREQLHWQ